MLKITIIAVGHLKEKYLIDASAEYEKRLSSNVGLKIIEIDPARLPENPNPSQINAALGTEAVKILDSIPNGAYVVPLCIEGTLLDSVQLSKKIESVALNGKSNICFIIGGSHGLSDNVKQKADLKLSMSKMTFPHQLARIMLLEQIYRAFKISSGSAYHK